MVTAYGVGLVTLQSVGIVTSLWFLATHRPRHWKRIQALDAMAFPVIVALVLARGLVLTVTNWPVGQRPMPAVIFSLAMLLLVDAALIVKLVNFRRFVRADRDRYSDQ